MERGVGRGGAAPPFPTSEPVGSAYRERCWAAFSFGGEGGEFLGQRRFEALRCGRVFFGVGLARHFQDPADFSQQRIHTGERQRALGRAPHSVLRRAIP